MPEEKRLNVLAIFADQLRRDALSVYGDRNIQTPNLDEMSRAGVRFTNACATYPICVPFRFTFMTGEYAHTRLVPGIEWRMSPAERTLADEFNEAGYETVYVGKWHLYGGHGRSPYGLPEISSRTPVPRRHQGRWQKWIGFELRNNPFDTVYFEDDDPTPRPIETYQTDGLFDLAMNHLGRRDPDRPICCVLSFEPPHNPFVAPEELQAKWDAREIELPPNFAPADEEKRAGLIRDRRRYYAMVENIDQNMGRLFQWLRETGLAANTVVVFFSDHGELGGSHGLTRKQHPYEESVGIPLIVWDPTTPGVAGRVIDEPTCTEDFYPTLLGLAGLRPGKPVPGADLTPLIRGAADRLDRPGVMLQFVLELRKNAHYHNETWRAFRSRRYKYTVLGPRHGASPWQLFDLEKDPYEMNNLVEDSEHREIAARHHKWLRDRLIETGDDYPLLPAFGQAGLNQYFEAH